METCEANETEIIYCNVKLDEHGRPVEIDRHPETGILLPSPIIAHEEPKKLYGVLNGVWGLVSEEQPGVAFQASDVFTVSDRNCPMREDAKIFIGIPYAIDEFATPLNNFRVSRIRPSINHKDYALEKIGGL